MDRVLLDLNNPALQEDWFSLERPDALAVMASFRKIRQMDWEQFYRDPGLRWEAILSRSGPRGQRIYSLRVTRRIRAVAYREGQFLRLLSLHSDHDSAYS